MNKKTKLILLLFLIILMTTIHSIAYSALSTTMNISGNAYTRIESDIRVTDFQISESSQNVISSYEEFNKTGIYSNLTLPNSDSYIIYKIEITNYGSANTGIKTISGLPDNLSYELIDYSLLDKICEQSNKCNLGAKKELYIKIKYNTFNSTNTSYEINIQFEFVEVCTISYENITNNTYQTTIEKNNNLTLNLSNSNVNFISVTNENETINHTYIEHILEIQNVTTDITIKGHENLNLDYTGSSQKNNYTIYRNL